MTASSGRALRIGVLLRDKLVEERVFTGMAPITFGQSLRCLLSIPGDGIPHEHVLFARDQGRTLLRITSSMAGRLAHGGTVRDELREGPSEQGVWSIPIERGTRGRLQIGDASVLFQEIAAPPIAPRAVLPASLRGNLADRIDRRLALVIGGSLLAHLGIAVGAWVTDLEHDASFAPSIAQTYRHDTMVVSLPDEPVVPTITDRSAEPTASPRAIAAPGAAAPATPAQTSKPIVAQPTVSPTPAPAMSAADAARFAAMLTGSDPGRGPGEMRDRQPGADLDQQIADVGDRRVSIGDDDRGFREQPGPRLGTDTGPRVDDPTQVTTAAPKLDDIKPGRITIRTQPTDDPKTTLTVDMVLAKINTVYMAGLQRCYKKGLLGEATLGGKVTLSFTVTPRGALDDTSARGLSSEVDGCIGTLMSGWRFTIPKDEDGDPTDARFKLGLVLTPG